MLAIRDDRHPPPQAYAVSPDEDARLRAVLAAGKGFNGGAIALARTPKAIRARAVRRKF